MSQLASPAATGGAGPDFETRVGAALLATLLVKGSPLALGSGTLDAVHLQSGHLGWATDDVLLEAVDSSGRRGKAAIQVKRSFKLSESDDECKATLTKAFADFRNAQIFNPDRDVLALVTSTLPPDGRRCHEWRCDEK